MKIILPLSDTKLRTLKPGPKDQTFFDGGGLYLLVKVNGSKAWRLKYRFNGKGKLLSLGAYPAVSLEEARKARESARSVLAAGGDPGAVRQAAKMAAVVGAENTFEAIARERMTKQVYSAIHAQTVMRRFERDIFPWIGSRPVVDITAADVLSVLRRIESRSRITAHTALIDCSLVFRYAISTGHIPSDPCRDLRGALAKFARGHFSAITEPAKVAELLRAIDGYEGSFVVKSALKIAPLVFVRPSELRGARWADIDLDAAEWRYLVTKTKTPHIVPLSRQVVEILRSLQPLTGRGEWVFPSERGPSMSMSHNAILAALRNLGYGPGEMTGHGFRAMARTILDEVLGVPAHLIEHQLAHSVIDPNGRAYNRTTHLPERRTIMQQWADYLDCLKAGRPASAVSDISENTPAAIGKNC